MLDKLRISTTYPRATQVLEVYRRWVVGQSKANLGKGKNSASGALKGSIKGYIKKRFNRDIKGRFTGGTELPSLRFEMLKYGEYVDEGVKGSKSTYLESMTSPFKFRNNKGSVPVKAISAWLGHRGLDRGLAFVFARSIYQKGIKAKRFFSKPFNSRYKAMVHNYHVAVADDIANNLANQVEKQLRKANKNKISK